MPTPDGKIGARDLCAGAAVERVIADGGVSSLKISATLQSDNFATGSQGWQINRVTGSAEFQDVVVRGTLNADDITTGTLSVDRIGSNSIGMGKIELTAALEATQYIQSTTYTPGSAGWRIEADGTAEFDDVIIRGTITAGAGSDVDWSYIQNVAIVNADITSLSADKINAGTLSASYIDTGTIGAYTINLANSASSKITSNNGTDWYIRGDGVAKFTNVEVTGDILSGSTIAVSTITASTMTTAGSGARVDISAETASRVKWYSSTALGGQIYAAGSILVVAGGGDVTVQSASGGTLDVSANAQLSGTNVILEATSILELRATGTGDQIHMWVDTGTSGTDGTAALPALAFTNDPNTGIFRRGTDQLAFTTAGTEAFYVDANQNIIGNTMAVVGIDYIRTGDGTAAAPSYQFTSERSGMYLVGTGQLGFSTAGVARISVTSTRTDIDTTFLQLPVKATTGDPSSPANGDCYVNTSDNAVRVYADAAWRDLVTW